MEKRVKVNLQPQTAHLIQSLSTPTNLVDLKIKIEFDIKLHKIGKWIIGNMLKERWKLNWEGKKNDLVVQLDKSDLKFL